MTLTDDLRASGSADHQLPVPNVALPQGDEIAYVSIGSITLESGAVIDDATVAVQTWGKLSPRR